MAEVNVVRRRPHEEGAERVAEHPARMPVVDVFEGADEYLLQADMPGVGRESLSLRIDEGELTVDGTRALVTCGGQRGRELATETRAADFHRKFTLPEGVDGDKIAAELAAGVLTVRLPKSPGVKPRRIEIKGAT